MSRTIRTGGYALALLLLTLTTFTPAIAQTPSNKYGFCQGLAGNPRVNNYTKLFVLGPSSPPGAMSGFLSYLHQKYAGYTTPEVGCRTFATAAEAETGYRQMLDEGATAAAYWPLVEIDWIPQGGYALADGAPAPEVAPAVTPKPAPAPVAAKPAAPAPAPAPAKPAVAASKPAVYVFCRSEWNTDLRRFYNPPVDGRGAGYAEWQASYRAFLVSHHAFKGTNLSCGKYLTQEAAQADYDQLVSNARASPTINGQPSPVIITNWTY